MDYWFIVFTGQITRIHYTGLWYLQLYKQTRSLIRQPKYLGYFIDVDWLVQTDNAETNNFVF